MLIAFPFFRTLLVGTRTKADRSRSDEGSTSIFSFAVVGETRTLVVPRVIVVRWA
jgi:hypothetical protein